MESSLLTWHNTSHLHFIDLHSIRRRRYLVYSKQPSTFITYLDLALASFVQRYQLCIEKTFASSCMVFGSLCNGASLVPTYGRHIHISSSLLKSLRIHITSSELIKCIFATLAFTHSFMPVPKSCGLSQVLIPHNSQWNVQLVTLARKFGSHQIPSPTLPGMHSVFPDLDLKASVHLPNLQWILKTVTSCHG